MSSFIPENAPFNKEQRAWLNGFFSGLMGVDRDGPALAVAGPAMESLSNGRAAEVPAEPEPEEDFPWHDSALPIADRMEMAEGKSVERRLMAAMAQLDCGTCGYVCKTYGEAIASGEESNLTLCSPGGKETSRVIKKILKEKDSEAPPERNGTASSGSASNETGPTEAGAFSRQNPFPAKLIESRLLNLEGSAKDTRHVVIDLKGSNIQYDVGDALGIYPTNCEKFAERVVAALAADGQVSVSSPLGNDKPLVSALIEDSCLKDPSDELIELLISRVSSSDSMETLQQYLEDGVPDGTDVLDVLQLCPNVSVSATEFVSTLGPLNPRLYSIASSQKRFKDEVHLTVGRVAYQLGDRERLGVASTMLSDRLNPGDTLRVFRQPNHGGFTIPDNPDAPMIMIGPGTGIAPFVAFLQERLAIGAGGKNWLFFGDQHEAFDFLYRDELMSMVDSGVLTRMHTAFSRDGDRKIYVQNRMLEQASELWKWIKQGAYVFVCGDASRMAVDVDRALCKIASDEAGMSETDAKAFWSDLTKQKRYVRDVY